MWRKWQRRFAGKHVVITGGSKGIGLELGRQLALAGAKVTLVARGLQALQAATAELREVASPSCIGFQAADVTDLEQVRAPWGCPTV